MTYRSPHAPDDSRPFHWFTKTVAPTEAGLSLPVFNIDRTQFDKIPSITDEILVNSASMVREGFDPPKFQHGDAVMIEKIISSWGGGDVAMHKERPGIIVRVLKDDYVGIHSYVVLFGHHKVEMHEEEMSLIHPI